MNFEEIWVQLKKRQPRLADEAGSVVFTVPAFRSLLKQVHTQGEKQGEAKASEGLSHPFEEIFGSNFSKGKK